MIAHALNTPLPMVLAMRPEEAAAWGEAAVDLLKKLRPKGR